ncbi:MAG TPA: ABC transporter permease [Opitutus sp.]|nr:ABC transporter permease [Opitutus sp.]
MLHDLRFALRMIRTHRWFSAAVIITLALGIGINTTVFTLTNAVLFKPVPVPNGDRLVTVSNYRLTNPQDHMGICWLDYLDYKAQQHTLDGLEAFQQGEGTISEAGVPPERFTLGRITPGLFTLIQMPPALGRGFSPDDGKAGAAPVVLLGAGVWKNRYGSDPGVIGRVVHVNGATATIVGVMPDGFKFPNNEDFWMPLVPTPELEKRTTRVLQLFALRRTDVSVLEANTDISVIAGRLAVEHADTNKEFGAIVRTFQDTYNGGPIRAVFFMMLGAVGFVLLIACANVANMMLGRAIVRSREIAVRAAMGATRWQLVRQLLIESVLLSSIGGALGLGLSLFGVHAFDLSVQNVGKPYWIVFTMDWRAFAYFAAISILSGVIFGLLPALRASRVDLNTAMKDGTAGAGSSRNRLAGALVVLQFALTVVLLAGAGMMIRSFFAAQQLNSFVGPQSIFTARLQLPEGEGERYHDSQARWRFFQQLLPELRALPGATEVSAASSFPGLGAADRNIEIEGQPITDPEAPPRASFIVETPGYLPSIRLPLLSGRYFNDSDGDTGHENVIVTRDFAARYWPGASPLGKRFRLLTDDKDKPDAWMTVIGVSADLQQDPGRDQTHVIPPLFHVTYREQPWGWMGIMIRTQSDPAQLARAVRATVQKLDPDLPLFEVRTLSAAIEHNLWFLNVFGTLFSIFALIGLLMASVGIYAVIAQNTARRTREIGIRMALGATGGKIATLVLSRGFVQLGLGLAIGLAGGFAATRLLKSVGFLIGISPNDPLVFAAITVLLIAIGAFACWLPARRAARVSPIEALRTE